MNRALLAVFFWVKFSLWITTFFHHKQWATCQFLYPQGPQVFLSVNTMLLCKVVTCVSISKQGHCW